jgi:hypothetical protein
MARKVIEQNAEKALNDLINATNVMGGDKDVVNGMVNAILSNHPTLVQSFFRALVSASKEIDGHRKFQDPRCANSGEVVKLIANWDGYLPFI